MRINITVEIKKVTVVSVEANLRKYLNKIHCISMTIILYKLLQIF